MSHKPVVSRRAAAARQSVEGLSLLIGIVAIMWIVEVVNSLDSYRLDADGGLMPREVDRVWAIFTSPFLHAGWQHLIDNTIPFVFMGVIIALRGATKLALVTLIVIIVGGLGTWLIAPAGSETVGASGVVFGYATYLFTCGLFERSALQIFTGVDRRRGLGRGAGVERRAPRRDLVAGPRMRRHRRRDRGVAARRARRDARLAPTPRRRRASAGASGRAGTDSRLDRSRAGPVASARCGSSPASSRPGESTWATTSGRSPSTSRARTAARRSTAWWTSTPSPWPTSPPSCVTRSTTPPPPCWPRGLTRRAASSSASQMSRSTPSCAGCCRR